ncbi:MAG: Na+/H+ antiporter subunit E [Thiotrichales bacterium]
MKYVTSLTLILSAIWLLLSGYWDQTVLLILGALSVASSIWLSHRLGILNPTAKPLRIIMASLRFLPWLLVEIVKSNLHVARRILSPRLKLNPRITRMEISQKTDLGRALLANTITLTPGTTTIHVRERELWFYAFDEESVEETLMGELSRRVSQFEEDAR